ncbi:MAG TPA: hypothetical protein VHR66_19730 [Gemmataceae bacterium]|jgi:nitrate/nitrite transporter NarK|nr:hypothetical protein [Gemmataceae bacterium]
MSRVAIVFGLLLIGLGLVGYLSPTTFGVVGPEGTSPTALIPAGFGAVLLLCGVIVEVKPTARKHVMHLAAMVGLLGAIGGIMPLQRNKFDLDKSGSVAGLLMIAISAIFVVLCVRSFVLARVARSEGLPEERATK